MFCANANEFLKNLCETNWKSQETKEAGRGTGSFVELQQMIRETDTKICTTWRHPLTALMKGTKCPRMHQAIKLAHLLPPTYHFSPHLWEAFISAKCVLMCSEFVFDVDRFISLYSTSMCHWVVELWT